MVVDSPKQGRKRSPISSPGGDALADMDRLVVAALQVNPRASWQQIAKVLDVSESTVSRRAKRLLDSGSVHIAAVPDPLRCRLGFPVLMQVECAMGAAESVARTLSLRPDVRFVALLTGTYDLVLEIVVPSRNHLGEVVFREFNLIPGIRRTTTETVIRNFKMTYDWSRSLLGANADKLESRPKVDTPMARIGGVDTVDLHLIQLLASNGRLSASELAQQSEASESSVRRRLDALESSGAIRFATLVDPTLMGFESPVFLWLEVDLAAIEGVAASLSSLPEVRYLSATAGYSDLVAEAILPDLDHLYLFMTEVLGTLPGIRRSEVSLEINTIKRGYLTEDTSTGQSH